MRRIRSALRRAAPALALVLGARSAGAAPPPIEWDAPPGCPTQAEVESLAATMLAGSLRAAPAGLSLRFSVRVGSDGRWVLRGTSSGPGGPGERTLTAVDCELLGEAAALLVALAVDPSLAAEVPQEDGGFPPEEPPAPAEGLVPPAPPAVEPPVAGVEPGPVAPETGVNEQVPEDMPRQPAPPIRRVWGELGVAAGLGLGALPRAAALLRLHGGVRVRWFRGGVRVSAWLPREAPAPDRPEVGGRFWLASAGIYGCGVVWSGRRVTLPLCAAIDAGVVSGEGVGALQVARRARAPWAAASAGPTVLVRVHSRVAVLAAVEGLAVLARPRFEVSGAGEPCCGSTFGGQFLAGLALSLP